jgi:hypothetical protein
MRIAGGDPRVAYFALEFDGIIYLNDFVTCRPLSTDLRSTEDEAGVAFRCPFL